MMRGPLIGLMLALIILLLIACSTGISQRDHDAVVIERDALVVDLANVRNELTVLKAIYPPKPFLSGEALQTWLGEDDISERGISADAIVWLGRALELQRRAAEDGYIISVELTQNPIELEYYTVLCTAVVADSGFYFWDPETDEVFYWLDTRHF